MRRTTKHHISYPLLPVDSYAFRFLQALKKVHAEKKNFKPVSSSEIISRLPPYLQSINFFEGIELFYNQKVIQIHSKNRFSLDKSYR